MKKVGEIIKSARVKEKLSIKDVARATKISEEYIQSIESDRFENLPDEFYAQLYVKKYAQFLNLSPEKLTAVFRRDYQKKTNSTNFSLQKFNFFSKWQGYIAGGLLGLIFIGYLSYQYFNFVRPPGVKINRMDLTSQGWQISGKTSSQATVKINDEIVNLDEEGRFDYTAGREDTQIRIIVESPTGRTKEVIRQLE